MRENRPTPGACKRLGERLHPHEYPEPPHAQDVFAVARGDRRVRSLAGRVELALAAGDLPAPGAAEAMEALPSHPREEVPGYGPGSFGAPALLVGFLPTTDELWAGGRSPL